MAKILLVDDSDTYRIKFKTYLEDKGHVVIDGIDGEEGLNLAETSEGLDLIISDLRLPLFDGLTMILCDIIIKYYINVFAKPLVS